MHVNMHVILDPVSCLLNLCSQIVFLKAIADVGQLLYSPYTMIYIYIYGGIYMALFALKESTNHKNYIIFIY